MNPLHWLAYAGLVGGLITLAAWLLGRLAVRSGRQSRMIWVAAALLTVALPLLAPGRPSAPSRPIFPVGPGWQWPVASAEPGRTSAAPLPGEVPSGLTLTEGLLAAWVLASVSAAAWVLLSYRTLVRQRRTWRLETVRGEAVLVSPDFGPAVVGVFHPAIVIPEWFGALSEESQRLALLHEGEHLRAHDSRLLALLLGLVVAMPWQPFLWVQLAALRLALEFDCDRRVLRQARVVKPYAELLLALAGRVPGSGWALPLVALWSVPTRLEQRLRRISERRPVSARELAAFGSLAALALLLACAARPPVATGAATLPGHQGPRYRAESDSVETWTRRLEQYFETPVVHHPAGQLPVYWFVLERDGSVVRHDTGGVGMIHRDDRYWQTYQPESYRRARARADSAGRTGPLGGFYTLDPEKVRDHFVITGRGINAYGMRPMAFGADSIILVWGQLAPIP